MKKLAVFLAALMIVCLLFVVACGSGTESSETTLPEVTTETTAETAESTTESTEAETTTTTEEETTTTEAAIETWSDGTYEVGVDIPAGLYKSTEDSGTGYWQISKDASGEFDSIIANDNTVGQCYLELADGQFLTLNGITVADANLLKPDELATADIAPGVYLVGTDIAAGKYKGIPNGEDWAYWQVSTSPNGELSSIKANANPAGQFYVEVADGQYLKVTGSTVSLAN